jgi:hypothetical protein
VQVVDRVQARLAEIGSVLPGDIAVEVIRDQSRFIRKSFEEIQHHLDSLTERKVAAGMCPGEARNAARREFGGVEQCKELAREQRVWMWPDQLRQDVRFGTREVEEAIERMRSAGNMPDVVIIDHVDLMKGTNSQKSDWEAVSDIMVELKMLAKRLNIIIITASQANFSKEIKGMERFYRSKVGKAANSDIIFMIDDVIDKEYFITLSKARGRKRIPTEERQKVLLVDWETMSMKDIT